MNYQELSFCDQLQNQINNFLYGVENSEKSSKPSRDSINPTYIGRDNIAGSGLSEQEIYYLILGIQSEPRDSIDSYIEKGKLLKEFLDKNKKQNDQG